MGGPDALTASDTATFRQRAMIRLRTALPGKFEILFGAPAWGAAMGLSALVALFRQNRLETFHLNAVLLLYVAAGTLAWPAALFMARLLSGKAHRETRFAAYFLFLTVFTIGLTALIFAAHYRQFFTQWHAPFGSRVWMFQFVYTMAGAIYQFLVMGIRLFLPLGFAGLVVASLWLAGKQPYHRR